jgi:hypothetical protein
VKTCRVDVDVGNGAVVLVGVDIIFGVQAAKVTENKIMKNDLDFMVAYFARNCPTRG